MISSLFVISVNWNLKYDTSQCIYSLIRAGIEPGQIIVVDNASQDGSVDFFRNEFGDSINIIETNENLGYAAGINLGLHHAISKGADWCLLINNDTYIAEDFFNNIEYYLSNYSQYQVFGPSILYADNPSIVWYLGDNLLPGIMQTINRYRGKGLPEKLPEVIPVDFISGCAMLIRSDLFQTIGYFDSGFFMYGEEVDWCWRARKAGYKFAAIPSAKMWHKISSSAQSISILANFLRIRNQIWIYKRYGHGWQIVISFIFSIFKNIVFSIKYLIKKQILLFKSCWKGWFCGWFSSQSETEDDLISTKA